MAEPSAGSPPPSSWPRVPDSQPTPPTAPSPPAPILPPTAPIRASVMWGRLTSSQDTGEDGRHDYGCLGAAQIGDPTKPDPRLILFCRRNLAKSLEYFDDYYVALLASGYTY